MPDSDLVIFAQICLLEFRAPVTRMTRTLLRLRASRAMRISDDRYHRERQHMELALRFLRYEARTRTIHAWTGLSDDRIRKLYRSYLADSADRRIRRHRGKSPQRAALFLRSARLREQSALLASLYRLLGLLPARAQAAVCSAAPSLRRAELLCQAYELYRSLVPEASLSFEHALFLQSALARADELACGTCRDCNAVLVIDRWSVRTARCTLCDDGGEDDTDAAQGALARATVGLQDFPDDGLGSARGSAHLLPATAQ